MLSTQWGKADADVHNARVTHATRLLYERYLPSLAEKLVTGHRTKADQQLMDDDEEEEEGNRGGEDGNGASPPASLYPATFDADSELQAEGVDIRFLRLSEELHCHGLNVRHLGRLRHHVLEHYREAANASDVALLLLVEMVGRALKGLLRQRLRRCVEQVQRDSQSADYSALRETVAFLNLCSHHHPTSASFWTHDVVTALHARFTPLCLTDDDEGRALFSLVSPHLCACCRTCAWRAASRSPPRARPPCPSPPSPTSSPWSTWSCACSASRAWPSQTTPRPAC